MTAFFYREQTFPFFFFRNIIPERTDGGRRGKGNFPEYALRYAFQGGEMWISEKDGIPVDNSEFSTLSTTLSTGVFHKRERLWIFILRFT